MKTGLILLCISLFSFFNETTLTNEEDPIITKELTFKNFDGVSLNSSFDVSIKYGAKQKVLVTGSEKLINKLDARLSKTMLELGMKKGRYHNLNLKVEITIPHLRAAYLKGSGDIKIGTFANLSDLELMLTGSGDILAMDKLTIKNNVGIKITGSGNISIKGTAAHSDVALIGSGDCNASHLKTTSNTSSILGSGNIKVNASKHIEVNILGSGDLYFKGNPSIEQTIRGSGKIQHS